MKYIIPLAIIFILLSSLIKDTEFPSSLIENAEKYNLSFPTEHVYLTTDKSYYKPGDELWFKAITKNSLQDKELSNDLNIKLIDVFGNQVLNLRFPLLNSESKGYLVIPAYISDGKYYLIGYTGWMKNLPVTEAYRKEIIVSNNIQRKLNLKVSLTGKLYYPGDKVEGVIQISFPDGSPAKSVRFSYTCSSIKKLICQGAGTSDEKGIGKITLELPKDVETDFLWLQITAKHKKRTENFINSFPVARKNVDVQFFPEGGRLIAGIENKIAFKATDSYGLPVDIEGFLMDEKGKQVGKIESSYMGMGKFTFNPEKKQYKMLLAKPMVENNIFSLPEVQPSGIQLNFLAIKDGEILFEFRNSNTTNIEKVNFVIEQFGKIGWAATVDFINYKLIGVPEDKFDNGVIKCTIFDNAGNIIAFRSLMLEITPAGEIVNMVASKDYFGKREKVYLELKNLKPGNVSATLAVYNDKYIDDTEISPYNYLNCFVWLRDANLAYFKPFLANENLDLILLTHETRSLPLAGLCRNDYAYSLPYYNQDGITGQLLDKRSHPVENARVKLIHSADMRTFQASSDAKGVFNIKFDNRIINYNFLNVAIADESGKSGSSLTIYDHYSDNTLRMFTLDKDAWEFYHAMDMIKYENPLVLYTGKYRQGKKKEKREFTGKGYNYKKYSSYLSVADIIKELKGFKLVNGEIVFSGRQNLPGSPRGALIVIDGIAMGNDAEILNTLSPKELRNISISTTPVDIQRYMALNSIGVIEISTIRGGENIEIIQKSDIQLDMLILDHEYTGPDYSMGEIPESDNRTTLFWKPDLAFDDANPSRIMFYTSDITGTYICSVTGTDSNGNLFSKKIRFIVR